jgi:hypothetical protein
MGARCGGLQDDDAGGEHDEEVPEGGAGECDEQVPR